MDKHSGGWSVGQEDEITLSSRVCGNDEKYFAHKIVLNCGDREVCRRWVRVRDRRNPCTVCFLEVKENAVVCDRESQTLMLCIICTPF